MFKKIFDLIKLGLFTVTVLILSHIIPWKGQTISDHIKDFVTAFQPSLVIEKAKGLSNQVIHGVIPEVIHDVKQGLTQQKADKIILHSSSAQKDNKKEEKIDHSERKKLRDLIRELNSDGKD